MSEPFSALRPIARTETSRATLQFTQLKGLSALQSCAREVAMALQEAIYSWRTRGLDSRNGRNGGALELSVLGGKKNRSLNPKGVGVNIVDSTRRCRSTSLRAIISLQQLRNLSVKSSVNRPRTLFTYRGCWSPCRAKSSNEDDAEDNNVSDENGTFDRNGFDRNGRDRFGRDQLGLDEDGLDKMGIPGDAVFDMPIIEPEYSSYIDPNTGEPSPTYGFRNPLPNAAFWGEDLSRIQKSSPSSAAVERFPRSSIGDDGARTSDTEASDSDSDKPRPRRRAGRRRKKENSSLEADEPHSEELSEEELVNIAQLESLKDKFRAEEEGGEYKSMAQMIKESKEEEKAEEEHGGVGEDGEEEEEEEDVSLGKLYGDNGLGDRGYALIGSDNGTIEADIGTPLTNEELWWNWQKPPPGKKPWSAWQKRAGDSDTVMAAAMAETGQIKLFGEKPTIAEATLARARKHVFYNERMEAEEARKKEIGALAYYKEWVKAYKKDTSKEAVQKHLEETGEDEGIQLLDMFAHQTAGEYRIMMGTDVRIRRDPLTMRMRPDQIKQVWGGDPVYPTINYEQSPDHIADYRNENMHEPIPDIVEMLRESGRLLTQEEVKAMLEEEKIEDDEVGLLDGLAGAVDIGDEDEDELDEEDDEIQFEDQTSVQSMLANTSILSKKSSPTKKANFELDEVIVAAEVIDADEVDEGIDVDRELDAVINADEVVEVIDVDGGIDVDDET